MKTSQTSGSPVKGNNTAVAVAEEEGKPFFMYGTKTMEYKGQTYVRRAVVAGIQTAPNAIRIATSICSEKDRFTRVKGKSIAISRAKSKKPDDVLYLTDDTSAAKQFLARASKLVDPINKA